MNTKTNHLEASLDTFNASINDLMEKYPKGYFVLIIKEKVIGAYETYGEALSRGYQKSEDRQFFVKQIKSPDEDFEYVLSPIFHSRG